MQLIINYFDMYTDIFLVIKTFQMKYITNEKQREEWGHTGFILVVLLIFERIYIYILLTLVKKKLN